MANTTIQPFGSGQAQVSAYAPPYIEISDSGDVSQALNANTYYKFTQPLTSLSITLNSASPLVMYAGKFTAASGWGGTGLSVPAGVMASTNSNTILAGYTYEFNIVDNVIKVEELG